MKQKLGLAGILLASVAVAATLTFQGALNTLVGAPTGTTYTTQGALNILYQGHADSLTKYTQQQAANRLVVYGAQLGIPAARTNTALVRVNGAWTTMNTTGNVSAGSAPDSTRYHFLHQHDARIRRDCNIKRVRIYLAQGTEQANLKRVTVQFWRRHAGGRLHRVGETPNLIVGSGAGIRDVTFNTAIPVKMGDYQVVYSRKVADQTVGNVFAAPATTNAALRQLTADAIPSFTSQSWYAATSLGANLIEVECYADKPPQVVAIGYSQIEGQILQFPYAHSIANSSTTGDTASALDPSLITTGWDYYLFNTLRPGVSYENAGVGGNTAAAIIARASRDCFALKPRIAIVQMGGNDTDSSLVYTHMSTFLDSCQARSILPVVLGMGPMTSKPGTWAPSTLAYMRWRDRVNKSLQVLCQTHAAKAIYVEMDGLLGKNRAAGPIGNRWDIQTSPDYDDDGLHYSVLGQPVYAQTINNALKFDFTRP